MTNMNISGDWACRLKGYLSPSIFHFWQEKEAQRVTLLPCDRERHTDIFLAECDFVIDYVYVPTNRMYGAGFWGFKLSVQEGDYLNVHVDNMNAVVVLTHLYGGDQTKEIEFSLADGVPELDLIEPSLCFVN